MAGHELHSMVARLSWLAGTILLCLLVSLQGSLILVKFGYYLCKVLREQGTSLVDYLM